VIRIVLVDDHPAVRAGLYALLRREPGFVPVAACSEPEEAMNAIDRERPTVVLLDHQLDESSGLLLCHRLRLERRGPRVVVYSAFADDRLSVSAVIAGADGVVSKDAPAEELFDAIREVARGGRHIPTLPPPTVEASARRLDPDDLPIFGMLIGRTPLPDIARALRLSESEAADRVQRMVLRLGAA
jgi:DNA-binding NarL/FixJ family response regulator